MGNANGIDRIPINVRSGNLPNLLLSGPPCCDKMTTIVALARQTLGHELRNTGLVLNASDDRFIDTVRNEIKQFLQTKVTLPHGHHKIVILDEADYMTPAAQHAMR